MPRPRKLNTEIKPEEAPNESEAPAVDVPDEGQSAPATVKVVEEVVVEAPTEAKTGLNAYKVMYQFSTDSKYFKADGSDDKEKADEMNSLVVVHLLEDFKGCVGISCRFDLARNEQVRLPYWFAIQHPTKLVVKGH